MFNLKGKVQNKMNSKYWSRGARVYSCGSVMDIYINENSEFIIFSSGVESSNGYLEYYQFVLRKMN